MLRLRAEVTVLSLTQQIRDAERRQTRDRGSFEVLVRHFVDRLLTNENFGEDTATRIAQLAYAIALPGVLVALFLFPAYHDLPPGPRPYWSQACDHLFYVMYALVVMGAVTVFQSELLFPDLTDVYVLTGLPLRRAEPLAARATALGLFLGAVLIGTNLLGTLFFPAVADLKSTWWRHLSSHAIAVALSGIFAAALLIGLQGLLLCLVSARIFRRFSAVLQALSLAILLMILFLFPALAHFLKFLLASGRPEILWFPPFWFLGLYEHLLLGHQALPIFANLASRAWAATALATALAALTFPFAFARRQEQLIEGAGMAPPRSARPSLWQRLLHRWLLPTPPSRAIYHLVGITLARSQRLQLYLAMYGGVGLALVLSGLLLFRVGDAGLRLSLSPWGLRSAAPVVAFWVVVGLRTALASPVGRAGRWIFPVIAGRPKPDQLRAAELWIRNAALLLAFTTEAVVLAIAPASFRAPLPLATQLLVTLATSVLLTDAFFRRERAVPFTEPRSTTTIELPIIFVRYFFLFPALILTVVNWELWAEASWTHLLKATLLVIAAHTLMLTLRRRAWKAEANQVDMANDESILPGLGLRD